MLMINEREIERKRVDPQFAGQERLKKYLA